MPLQRGSIHPDRQSSPCAIDEAVREHARGEREECG